MPRTDLPALALLGPTASGKSALALLLAERFGGEIVSCDSMQVYRGLDIGTAKPTLEEQRRCPHHLIDLLEISEPWDANQFVQTARPVIAAIQQRQALPVVTGGSGLYARALLYDIPLQPSDKELFAQVCREYDAGGGEALREELRRAGGPLHPDVLKNWRRLVRAVEILRITGRPPPLATEICPVPGFRQFVLMPELELLKERIARRTEEMLELGWIEETRRLMAAGLESTPTARQALGYPEILRFIQEGRQDRQALAGELVLRTIQYARRQRTWFKHQHPGAEILEFGPGTALEELASRIAASLERA